MAELNRVLLEQKIEAMRGFPHVDEQALGRLRAGLVARDDYGLYRMNPFIFADEHGLGSEVAVDLFVVAAKVGLLDFAFRVVCPGCGGVESAHGSWNGLSRDKIHCNVCRVDHAVALDEQVEVAFTIGEAVAHLDVAPFRSRDEYFRCYFSANLVRSPWHQEITSRIARGVLLVSPDGEQRATLDFEAGKAYRAISLDRHSATEIDTADDAGSIVEIDVVPGGLSPASARARPGLVDIVVRNRTRHDVGVLLLENALAELKALPAERRSRFRRFLSAKELLNHQRFRELFRAQSLDPSLRLRIRSLTLLFTDLKGSTALYDSTGDVTAYAVVQEHFAALIAAVRNHRGAVVKTMGDAVMASFSAPEDALLAAGDMLEAMGEVNAKVRELGYATGLKVGIHEGPALAVSADDRLDYFGQTVNVAARVQALADAGEIWVTDAVMSSAAVRRLVEEKHLVAEPRTVALKGVGRPTGVFRLAPL